MIRFRSIFYIGIIIFWFVTMAVLFYRHYGFRQKIEPVIYKDIKLSGEQWMGVYYNGEKIGYSHRKIAKQDNGYKISELLKMRLNVMNSLKDIETITDAYLDSDLGLSSFELSLRSDVSMNVKGRLDGKNLHISIETSSLKSEQTIPLKSKPHLNLSMIPELLKDGIKLKKRFSMLIIDPATLTQEDMNIEITSREQIMAMGIRQDAFKLKGSFKGIEFFIWLTEKGEVLREESPLGFTLIKEPKENAMKIENPSLDLIAQTAVPFNMKLPSDTNYLKIRLSNIDFKGLELDGGRQRLEGDAVEIRKEVLPPHPPLSKGGLGGGKDGAGEFYAEYLKDTMFIQSEDQQIVSLSKEIVKDEKDRIKAARLIYEWVFKNIKKTPTITIPMATEVLKTKRGDCNEHTTLFTALARAAGIPTRIALGLTYKDGYFYYHAWPEIYVNQWIAIDPTLGQFPADAAHIRIITGDIDKQMQLLSVMGKIKVEGLEYH